MSRRTKQSRTKHYSWNRWNDSWLLPEEEILSDVQFMQAMAQLAGCSMCAIESDDIDVDDAGDDLGDIIDIDQYDYV